MRASAALSCPRLGFGFGLGRLGLGFGLGRLGLGFGLGRLGFGLGRLGGSELPAQLRRLPPRLALGGAHLGDMGRSGEI